MRVLVIEDDAQLRDVLARALSEAGFRVEQAADGKVAEELAAAGDLHRDYNTRLIPGHRSIIDDCTPAVVLKLEDGQ